MNARAWATNLLEIQEEDLQNPFFQAIPKEDVKNLELSPENQESTGSTNPSTSEAKQFGLPPPPESDSLFCLYGKFVMKAISLDK